ncbi:Activator heat shock protein ATPase 1, partial [Tetrabaena socialis]
SDNGAAAAAAAAAAQAKAAAAAKAKAASAGGTRSISIVAKYHCRPADIFECFTVEGRVSMFTQSRAIIQPVPGGTFSWYGGSISGEFVELAPPNRIVMRWRFNTWEEGVFSK